MFETTRSRTDWSPLVRRCLALGAALAVAGHLTGAALAQAPKRKEIFVPVLPANDTRPSAPTIQAAIDLATGPTDISVWDSKMKTSDGFTAVDANVTVILPFDISITGAVTFTGCTGSGVSGKFVATELIAFQKCRAAFLATGRSTAGVLAEDCENVKLTHVFQGGLFVVRSTGVLVQESQFTKKGVMIRDCLAPPPADMAAKGWTYPVYVNPNRFEDINDGPAVFVHNSRVRIERNTFEKLGGRGIEVQHSKDCTVTINTLAKVHEVGIAVFDSACEVTLNKINDVTATPLSCGILVESTPPKDGKQPERARAKVQMNEIGEAQVGILALRSSVATEGNKVYGGQFGLVAGLEADGEFTKDICNRTKYFGMVLAGLTGGFRVFDSTMNEVEGYGMLVSGSKNIRLQSNRWTAHGESIDRMVQPVREGGICILSSEVTLANDEVASQMTGAGLLVTGGSKVRCTDGNSFVSTSPRPLEGPVVTGPGIVVDGSSVTGTISGFGSINTALWLGNGASVTADNGSFMSQRAVVVVVEGGSTLEMNKGRITGAALTGGPRPFVPGAADTVAVGGGSKLRLNGTEVLNGGARAAVHLTGGSQAHLESALLQGHRIGEQSVTLPSGRLFEGPFDGLLVEGIGTTATVRGGTLQTQRGDCIRVGAGGQVTVRDATFRLGDTNIHVQSGGNVELRGCAIKDFVGTGQQGLLVDEGGHAISEGNTYQFGHTLVHVEKNGTCSLSGDSLRNATFGIKAEPGAKVTATNVRFDTVTTPQSGTITKGDKP